MIKTTTGMLLFLFQITIANGSVITFEPPPCLICNSQLNDYEEAGLRFSGNASHHNTIFSGSADNGSSGVIRFAFMGSMSIQRSDGDTFSLYGIELAEYSDTLMGTQNTITFTGTRSGAATPVVQQFTIDGMIDGAGGMDDFESFTFSTDFTDLARVDVTGNLITLDNLRINAVPIPAAAWLFISGLLTLAGISNRRV